MTTITHFGMQIARFPNAPRESYFRRSWLRRLWSCVEARQR